MRDLKHASTGVDPGHNSPALKQRCRMRPAAASRIEHGKPGDLANQGKYSRPLVIGIPGVDLVIGIISRRERIIIILGQDFSLSEDCSKTPLCQKLARSTCK